MKSDDTARRQALRREILVRMKAAFDVRDWEQIERLAVQWVEQDPKTWESFKWLARASRALKKHTRAAYAYGRVLDFDPENVEAKKFFSEHPSLERKNQEKGGSGTVSAQMRAPAPRKPEAVILSGTARSVLAQKELELGEAYFQSQLHIHAAERFLQSHRLHPSEAAVTQAARALHAAGRSFEATKHLRDELNQNPKWHQGRVLLGRILFEVNRKAEAQREWQLVLAQEPAHREALDYLRRLLTQSP